MECSGYQRKFAWRLLRLALLSALLGLASGYARRHGLIPPSLVWLAALLPVLPMIGYFMGIGRWLQTLDELQRLIQLEALLIQFGATGLFLMSYGVLAKAGVVRDVSISEAWGTVWLAMFLSWTLGQLMVRRKYR
jgi:hypothetical protein